MHAHIHTCTGTIAERKNNSETVEVVLKLFDQDQKSYILISKCGIK